MRKHLRICLLVLIGAPIIGIAQKPAKVVFWSDDAVCGRRNELVTADDKFSCSKTRSNGKDRMTLVHNGVSLSVREIVDYAYFLLKIEIKNQGKEAIYFYGPSLMAAQYRDEAEFLNGKEPIVFGKPLTAPPAPVSQFGSPGGKTGVPHSPSFSNQTRAASEPGSKGAIGVSSLPSRTVPNYTPRGPALYTSRILPGKDAGGLIYFQLEKQSKFKILFVEIGDTKYVFQLRPSE